MHQSKGLYAFIALQEKIMDFQRIRILLNLTVLSISCWANAMPVVHFDTEEVNEGERTPVCWYQTEAGERQRIESKEEYFKIFGRGQLISTKKELLAFQEKFCKDYLKNPRYFFAEEKKVEHEVVLCCISGETQHIVFPA
jgi:hypothetical protein